MLRRNKCVKICASQLCQDAAYGISPYRRRTPRNPVLSLGGIAVLWARACFWGCRRIAHRRRARRPAREQRFVPHAHPPA
jgi:hypothetical protein